MKPPRIKPLGIVLVVAACVGVCPVAARAQGGSGVGDDALQTAGQLDLCTANLFHKRLTVLTKKADVEVWYVGPLAQPRRPGGFKVLERVEDEVAWNITEIEERDSRLVRVLFRVRVSLQKQEDSIATCKVNGKTLYLQVTGLPEKWTVDTELPQAHERTTIRHLLEQIGTAHP